MKNLLILLFCIISINLFAQDWDENEGRRERHNHDKYKKDYFTIGLYTGSYIGHGNQTEKNFYFNSFSAEIEYFKFSDLSIYARGIYQLSNTSSPYHVTYVNNIPLNSVYEEPFHYKMIISFGGRYYARKEGKVKPYVQLGINQETQFQENTEVKSYYPDGTLYESYSYGGGYNFYYFMNIGIGFNIKISNRFNFDMKYDLNKSLENTYYSFNGFSVLAGLKYNL